MRNFKSHESLIAHRRLFHKQDNDEDEKRSNETDSDTSVIEPSQGSESDPADSDGNSLTHDDGNRIMSKSDTVKETKPKQNVGRKEKQNKLVGNSESTVNYTESDSDEESMKEKRRLSTGRKRKQNTFPSNSESSIQDTESDSGDEMMKKKKLRNRKHYRSSDEESADESLVNERSWDMLQAFEIKHKLFPCNLLHEDIPLPGQDHPFKPELGLFHAEKILIEAVCSTTDLGIIVRIFNENHQTVLKILEKIKNHLETKE